MEEFPCKVSEKSSPSFPEDADYDEEQLPSYNRSHGNPALAESPIEKFSSDVTLVVDDEDDEMEGVKPFSSNLNSPKPNIDINDKKVHWTTRHVQLLLNRVEEHLDEFNVQKKHKAVWQAIGAEMEPYGFTTEHCYNKWKNLRRDVRLLVNNPSKVVRNAAILRQVARLILVIYPNVNANTMQVCDRSGIKSLPATPGGQGGANKSATVDTHYSGFNSPHNKFVPEAPRHHNSLYTVSSPVNIHSTPNSVEKSFCSTNKSRNAPSTALFIDSLSNGDKLQHIFHQASHPEPDSTGPFQFPFSQAAAALFFQSQLFSDLVKQQLKSQMDSKSQDQVHDLSAPQNGVSNPFSILQQALGNPACNDLNALSVITANLLNGMAGLTPHVNESDCSISNGNGTIPATGNNANSFLGVFPNVPHGLLERFAPNSCEITEAIESLRAEDDAHFRVADMMSDAAEQLRMACQRRQVALDKLLGLVQGHANNGGSAGDTGNVT